MITNEHSTINQINPIRKEANKIADTTNKNKTHNIVIDGIDTHIPNNLPIAIIGDKGSGKSTLIKSIINVTHKNHVFNHIFFIYSSITWDEELPPYVTRVDINDADEFLATLFETKAIFNSYYKFFKSINFDKLEDLRDSGKLSENDITKLMDNNVQKYNKDIINKDIDPIVKINKIIDTGEKILKTFSKPFNIGSVTINGLHANDLDAVIIDDIAIASKVLFRQIKDNPLYEYFTLTRHMRLFICLSGQQVEQIPKSLRREIMCWLFSKNTNTELLAGVLQKSTLKKIEEEQRQLNKYEFAAFNCVDGSHSVC